MATARVFEAQAWATARTACGCPNALGDFRVACRGARRDRPQGLPDALLKSRALHIEWQIEPKCWRLDEADHPGHYMLEVWSPPMQLCLREAVLEIAYQRIGIVAEHDGADALVSGCDQDRAQ